MRKIRFDPESSKVITKYGSRNAAFAAISAHAWTAHLGVMFIGSGGLVGYHQARGDQLFLVLQGLGWVTGADRQREPIEAGQAAFWQSGEWHEAGSDEGMTVLIVEGENLQTAGL